MSDCCTNKTCELEALRHRQAAMLKAVPIINAAMFGVEFLAGLSPVPSGGKRGDARPV
jgi:hypothetical protein